MSDWRGSLAISAAQSCDLVRLSGDANPLHVDPLYARRLPFGGTVVHGVHHLLAVWDSAFSQLSTGLLPGIAGFSAAFPNPVGFDRQIDYCLTWSPDGASASLSADAGGRRILNLSIKVAACVNRSEVSPIPDLPVPLESPVVQGFPPRDRAGSLALCCERNLALRLFPCLARHYGAGLLAPILACTRLVGMKCPGLHSVFSGLALRFGAAGSLGSAAGTGVLDWSVGRMDERFRMVRIGVRGPAVEGTVDAFFRPEPVAQPDFASVRARVPSGRFADCRALVIGGTRGVGEIAAKILAAGGARVTVTYAQGAADAERVCAEILAGGGDCRVLRLDVSQERLAHGEPLDCSGAAPTHCLYFASPHIAPNKTRVWDCALFAGFCAIYVDAFARVVRALADGPSPACTFFYPSSIYVAEPEKGFAEYGAAKGAGEALCVQLAARYPAARFLVPRLARMATDQTASIVPVKSASVLETMLGELLAMDPRS